MGTHFQAILCLGSRMKKKTNPLMKTWEWEDTEVTVELGGTGIMVVQVISEATVASEWAMVALERATLGTARITAVLVKALGVLGRAMEDLEDMVVLDIHLMASEEDTLEWAHTLMAVQVLFMECQDMGRWHTTHRLQLMVHKLLLTTHNHKLMTHNLLHLM